MRSRGIVALKVSSAWVIAAAFLLALGSIAVVAMLQARATSARDAQVGLQQTRLEFDALQSIPYDGIGLERPAARALILERMQTTERRIETTLATLRRNTGSPNLNDVVAPYRSNRATLERIRAAIVRGQGSRADSLGPVAGRSQRSVDRSLRQAGRKYEQRATESLQYATFGSAAMILALVTLFAVFYVRSRKASATTERLAAENTRLSLDESQLQVIQRLAFAAEFRDDVTGQHNRRVGDLSTRIGAALGMPEDRLLLLRQAAPLHDVGKIGIPDSILLKPGRLTHAEFEQMKTHTTLGATMLAGRNFPLLEMAEEIALTHHERWDGSGYPAGRSGPSIPVVGRIVAIADVFDALTHARPYKGAWNDTDALAEIRRLKGSQFDPEIVDAFLRVQQPEVTADDYHAPRATRRAASQSNGSRRRQQPITV
jgi:HD-GYP domain-containing protein (c-di-GMP phosphodiesterase class II)